MKGYTVKRLARLASVSVRTLHHYDHVGLLKPRSRTQAGYLVYAGGDMLSEEELCRGFTPEDAARIRKEARELWAKTSLRHPRGKSARSRKKSSPPSSAKAGAVAGAFSSRRWGSARPRERAGT